MSSNNPCTPPGKTLLFLSLLLVLPFLPSSLAVKRNDFKTCDQSSFCKRNRDLADRAGDTGSVWQSPYELRNASFASGRLSAAVSNALFPQIQYGLEVRFHEDGNARVVIDEVNGLRQRYNEASKWAFETEPVVDERDSSYEFAITDKETSLSSGSVKAGQSVRSRRLFFRHQTYALSSPPRPARRAAA